MVKRYSPAYGTDCCESKIGKFVHIDDYARLRELCGEMVETLRKHCDRLERRAEWDKTGSLYYDSMHLLTRYEQSMKKDWR